MSTRRLVQLPIRHLSPVTRVYTVNDVTMHYRVIAVQKPRVSSLAAAGSLRFIAHNTRGTCVPTGQSQMKRCYYSDMRLFTGHVFALTNCNLPILVMFIYFLNVDIIRPFSLVVFQYTLKWD